MTTWTRQLYEHDPLAIAKGGSNGYSFIHKFGANFDIDNNSEPETVWTAGGLYPWSALNTAQVLYLLSDDAADTGSVEIQGLDADYNPISEEIDLTGTVAVTTTNSYLRVYRMIYTGAEAGNAGTITARITSSSGTVVAQIEENLSQALMCIYTVPAGYTAFIMAGDFSVQKAKDAQILFMVRPFGKQNFRISHMAEVFESTYRYDFPIPLPLPEKTDLEVRADKVETNNTRVTSNFTMVLVKNTIAGEP
jgi:hypothetical protein